MIRELPWNVSLEAIALVVILLLFSLASSCRRDQFEPQHASVRKADGFLCFASVTFAHRDGPTPGLWRGAPVFSVGDVAFANDVMYDVDRIEYRRFVLDYWIRPENVSCRSDQ